MSRARRILTPLAEFLQTEAAGGAALVAAALVAVAWANASPGTYADLWNHELAIGMSLSLREWVGEGLMAVFFFVVGLEIKRELVLGELRDRRAATVPIAAAIGGMVLPAAIYAVVNAGSGAVDGWGIPMATDIAFAIGVLALLGDRVPVGLKLFLLTLAIVDDVGAILVIAIFYSGGLDDGWFAVGVAVIGMILVARRAGLAHPLWYVPLGVGLWLCVYQAGIHPTLAGVVLGLMTPTGSFHGRRVLERLEHWLHPYTSFAIVPLFALSHAGVPLGGEALRAAASSTIAWGVAAGLVVGKVVGIAGASLLAMWIGRARLPEGVRRPHLVGVAALGGIGFTVSLFIAGLAFPDGARFETATIGIFAASIASAVLGATVLAVTLRRPAGSEGT